MDQPLRAAPPDDLSQLSDEALLGRAAGGRQDAMAAIYDRYQGRMYGLALRITGDAATAQDVLQDAMVGIWRNASRFDPGRASAASWMLTIVHHRAVDAVRRRRPSDDLDEAGTTLPPALVTPDLWGEVRQRLDATAVRAALERLAPLQREAIELAYFGGLTQQEIAARTGAPLGTVKSRVRLGLQSLRTEIEAVERASGAASTTVGGA